MKPHRIAIIGGGLSGLATGTHLRLLTRHGADASHRNAETKPVEVTLFESSDRVGGVIHTETISTPNGEFVFDHGADMFATNPPAAIQLCRDLGVEDRLLRPKPLGRGAMIARGDELIPIPEGFVLMRPTKVMSMMTTSLLSTRGKLRLLGERFVTRRDESLRDESVGSFVRRRLGQECLDAIVAPLVAGIYTADVERLSMAATMKPIWDMESRDGSLAKATLRRLRSGEDSTERGSSGARYEQFRAFPGGMIEFVNALADTIGRSHIRTRTPVQSLTQTEHGIRVDPIGETFDQVVLTTPAPVTARLLGSIKASRNDAGQSAAIDQAVSAMRQISYASTAIVVMAVPRNRIARLPQTFGFVVPPGENRAVLAGSFASEKFAMRAPDDYVIIRAFVGGILNPAILDLDDNAIVRIVASDLFDLVGLDPTIDATSPDAIVRVIRWNNAMPQYEVGHLDRVASVESAMKQVPGIHLRTNSLGGVGIAPVIGAAKQTAQTILLNTQRTSGFPAFLYPTTHLLKRGERFYDG